MLVGGGVQPAGDPEPAACSTSVRHRRCRAVLWPDRCEARRAGTIAAIAATASTAATPAHDRVRDRYAEEK
jgi:hypothetical protein